MAAKYKMVDTVKVISASIKHLEREREKSPFNDTGKMKIIPAI